jgi:hypothetical protein
MNSKINCMKVQTYTIYKFSLNIKCTFKIFRQEYSYVMKLKKKLNYVAFSPQANYTDRATAACRRS